MGSIDLVMDGWMDRMSVEGGSVVVGANGIRTRGEHHTRRTARCPMSGSRVRMRAAPESKKKAVVKSRKKMQCRVLDLIPPKALRPPQRFSLGLSLRFKRGRSLTRGDCSRSPGLLRFRSPEVLLALCVLMPRPPAVSWLEHRAGSRLGKDEAWAHYPAYKGRESFIGGERALWESQAERLA